MATDTDFFAVTFLVAPLGVRTDYARFTAHERRCVACKQIVLLNAPLEVAGVGGYVGHLSNCRALQIFANGFDGNGGGGGIGGPLFGSSEPVFGSMDPVFGDN